MLSQYFFHLALKVYAREIARAVYSGILRREADDDGLDSYAREIGKTGNLSAVLEDIAASREAWEKHLYDHPKDVIRSIYLGLLEREPEPDALAHYAGQLADSKDLPALLSAIGKSSEHWEKLIGQRSQDLVRAVYQGLLGRGPDPEALTSCSNQLAESKDLSAILSVVGQSRELWERLLGQRSEELIHAIFRGLLNKDADGQALINYSDKLKQPKGVEEILSIIIQSNEFREKRSELVRRPVQAFSAKDLEVDKLVFMHIPKTGGTTLHHILVKTFEQKDVCPERFSGLRNYPAGKLVRYRYFSGHFDLPSVRLIPGRKKIITMLRDPVARLISLYYFQRAHKPEVITRNKLELARLANKYTLAEFFRDNEVCSHPAINNAMTRVLIDTVEGMRWEAKTSQSIPDSMPYLELAVKELDSFDAFGIMERYDDSLELISDAIGVNFSGTVEPQQVLDVIVDKEPGLRRIEKEPVTDEIRLLIEDVVKTDRALYNHATVVFGKRCSILRGRKSRIRA